MNYTKRYFININEPRLFPEQARFILKLINLMPLINEEKLEPCPINKLAIKRFIECCEIVQYPKKSLLAKPNDVADTLYYIISGSVSIIALDEDNNEVVLAYLNEGDFIGEIGMFYRTNMRLAMVRTRCSCELAQIKYRELFELFNTELKQYYGDLMFAFGLQLAERLLKTSRRVTRLAYMDVAGRIARTLLDMCKEPDAMSHPDGTQIHISRQEIGRIVGCSREVVGRVLKKMAMDGMINIKGMNIVVYHSR